MKKLILSLMALASFQVAIAQLGCSTYHRKACVDREGVFMKYDSQSKSAIMAKGQVSEFHMVAYNGLDYRVTVCAEELLGDQIKFKIYEKKKVFPKVVEDVALSEVETSSESEYSEDDYSSDDYSEDSYSEDAYSEDTPASKNTRPQFKLVKELLYDNSQDGFNPNIEFTAEGSMSLIIEVSVPGSSSKMKLKVRETACVGVLIEHIKSAKTGF